MAHPLQSGLTAPFPDHVKFASRLPFGEVVELLVALFHQFWADHEHPFDPYAVRHLRKPVGEGFSERVEYSYHGLPLFVVLVASKSTRGVSHFILDGQPCALLRPEAFSALAIEAGKAGYLLKRVDVAVDDDRGRFRTIDDVKAEYLAGRLDPPGRGRPRLWDSHNPQVGQVAQGWTAYVGKRAGAVEFVRIYQKHAEQVAKLGTAQGVPEQRVRWEVEFKKVKGGPDLSWDLLINPARYFAGHSELFASLAGSVEPRRVGRVVRDLREGQLLARLGHCRNSYGPTIEEAYWALGGDAEYLLSLLRRPVDVQVASGVQEVVGGGVPDRGYIHAEGEG